MQKSSLYRILFVEGITYEDAKERTAKVISENRKIPIDEAKNMRKVRKREALAVKRSFGLED